jgi:hypothetical protein
VEGEENFMKKIGELSLARVPPTHRTGEWMRAARTYVIVICKKCNVERSVSQGALAKYYRDGYICYDCSMADRKELAAAILALAKRKADILKKR